MEFQFEYPHFCEQSKCVFFDWDESTGTGKGFWVVAKSRISIDYS